jgi:hypothetical protein
MAHFIETDEGLINLDHVIRITHNSKGESVLHTVDGKSTIGCELLSKDEDLRGTIIPAAPGTEAVVLAIWASVGRPTETSSIHVRAEPIIAWREANGYATPVFLQSLLAAEYAFLAVRDGVRELAYDGGTFATLEDARADVLSQAQRRWDDAERLCQANANFREEGGRFCACGSRIEPGSDNCKSGHFRPSLPGSEPSAAKARHADLQRDGQPVELLGER